YRLYPPLLDGALQTLSCLYNQSPNVIYLPIGFDKITLYEPLSTQCYVHAILPKEYLASPADIVRAELTIFSAGGTIIAKIAGFSAKRTTQATVEKLLGMRKNPEDACYIPIWQPYTVVSEALQQGQAIEPIIYDARDKEHGNVFSLSSVKGLLALIQTQIQINASKQPLIIVTEQANSLQGENLHLNQALLNGFIKTAILEHPELSLRQLDVAEGQAIEPLLAALKQDNSREELFAYREEQWYVSRIVHAAEANRIQQRLSIPSGPYRLIKNTSGLLDELRLVEEETVVALDDNAVVITPKAVGLNFRDVLNAMNLYPGDPGPLGGDCAGVIQAVGKNVHDYQVGDEVLGVALGSLASQVITQVELIHVKPRELSFSQAAAIPTIFMTAYYSLINLAGLKAGETVLIHAGAGGVGLAAIQIAQYCQAKIIATAGSEEKRAYLQSLGVQHVLDSRSLRYREAIAEITHHQGVNVVLNSLSGKGFIAATLDCTARNGRFIEIGKRDIWSPEQVTAKRADIQYHTVALDTLMAEYPAQAQLLLHQVMELFARQQLTPIHQTVFHLTQAISAFKYLQQAKQIGKVVLELPPVEITFDCNASYLITGGLGGIGLAVAHYLCERGAGRMVLAGRHSPSDEAQTFIAQAQNAKIEVFQADVSNKADVEALIRFCHSEKFPLKGIFHLAGIIDDAPLDKQTLERFENVFAPKALGAWYLHELTQEQHITLDYFVLFSSIASLNGSPAQSNYATANSFLDGLAQWRQQQHLTALSINWGPWAQVGMAKGLVTTHQRRGLIPFKTQEGIQALDYALHQDAAELEIMQCNLQRMSESLIQIPSWLDVLLERKPESALMKQLQGAPEEQREALLKSVLSNEVKKVLGLPSHQMLDETKGFFELGMDSLMALELKNRLQALLNQPLSNTIAFDYPNLEKLVPYLGGQLSLRGMAQVKTRAMISAIHPSEPIAVIGLGCHMPGGADNPDAFWALLQAGYDASIEVPKTRWNIDAYYDPNPDVPGKMISRKSSFMTSPIDEFDAAFFGISPREAEYLDPQQRLLLETTWEALENARINPVELKGTQTGVFIGMCGSDYASLLGRYLSDIEIDAYLGTGVAASTATGRLSYLLGLQGPSMAIDTACSSSLVALHQACMSLRQGESDIAISGGVNVLLAPQTSIDFSQAHMLAPDGHCKTFDKSADGYVRGEGCGIIILKRLSDAQRDNDTILTVIRGSAVNQDGASSGLTVPNGPAQKAVIQQALSQAKLKPDEIDYIEAHGTGTALGDPIEVNALYHVFGADQDDNQRTRALMIGTVKTNIGHLEGAAGIAGIIKTILALQHEVIPQHLHFHERNPQIIDFAQIPAQLPLQPIAWPKQDNHIRRAGISSFGFSGTNAHVILEEAPDAETIVIPEVMQKELNTQEHLLIISGKTDKALAQQIQHYIEYLTTTQKSIYDICYSSQVTRTRFEKIIGVTGKTLT
ncbi:MAG: SDR family NAD(P)-dependent oxidoreductase, partial [Gammaproteobacteria bacterium]